MHGGRTRSEALLFPERSDLLFKERLDGAPRAPREIPNRKFFVGGGNGASYPHLHPARLNGQRARRKGPLAAQDGDGQKGNSGLLRQSKRAAMERKHPLLGTKIARALGEDEDALAAAQGVERRFKTPVGTAGRPRAVDVGLRLQALAGAAGPRAVDRDMAHGRHGPPEKRDVKKRALRYSAEGRGKSRKERDEVEVAAVIRNDEIALAGSYVLRPLAADAHAACALNGAGPRPLNLVNPGRRKPQESRPNDKGRRTRRRRDNGGGLKQETARVAEALHRGVGAATRPP